MQIKPQLFCFTYAGGNKSFFDVIEKDLDGIDVVKLEYAGHGARHKEPFYNNFDELADDMFHEVKARASGEYALFGYSMGSISAVEVLKRIIGSGMPEPSHIFLSAHEPHTKSELLGFTPDELDEWVKQRTLQFGDVPERLVNSKVFWRLYLPVYRADYLIIGQYKFEKLDLSTAIPTVIFYSETDTPIQDMKKWENYFKGSVAYCSYEGNHFFIKQHHKEMAQKIKDRLGALI
jgi:medium-chain acyl-[acyl-carrier-protein] hydrolase